MSGALQRIRLPPEAQAWAKKLNLAAWVKSSKWNKEPRFTVITKVREAWSAAGRVDLGDDPESIVKSAYMYFETDEEFTCYVLDVCEQDMTGVGEWEAAFTAYAWVVLQRYNKELGGEDG